jgi:predicted metal-dependent hydrolase
MTGSACLRALARFVELFNAGAFFEAHEVLEDYWREDQSPERPFYQGLIQIAAACVHLQKGTPEGAQKLLQKARQHLAPYLPVRGEFDLEKILTAAAQCLQQSSVSFPKIQFDSRQTPSPLGRRLG